MKSRDVWLGAISLCLAGCGSAPQPVAGFTKVQPDMGVNVATTVEVRAGDYRDPAIIDEVAELLRGLAQDIRDERVKPGEGVQFVQALIFVNSPDDPKQKLGNIRFPLEAFVSSGGDLEAADDVQLRSYSAAQPWCADEAHRVSSFCVEFESGAT